MVSSQSRASALLDANVIPENRSASTGTDAQPYFRIFNPLLQSQKVDPDGAYIARYVPELAHLAGKKTIHEPVGVKGYPKPMVSHDEVRKKTLAVWKKALLQTDGAKTKDDTDDDE